MLDLLWQARSAPRSRSSLWRYTFDQASPVMTEDRCARGPAVRDSV